MTLIQLEYFLKVAEELNFTRAAEKLYISQQGISRQIRLLEEEFGFPLFERTTRSVSLTVYGKSLHKMLEHHRKEFHELVSDAMLAQKEQQEIRLGILDVSKIIDHMVPALDQLEQIYPHIRWEYRTGYFSELQDAVENNELDMIITLSTELPESHPRDQVLVLKDLDLCLLIADRHPLAQKEEWGIEIFEREALMTYAPDFSYDARDYALEDCRQKGIRPKEIKYYSNFNRMEMDLLAGKGAHIGFDIFFRDPMNRIKKYPIQKARGLEKANLVLAWMRPEYTVFAKIIEENLRWQD